MIVQIYVSVHVTCMQGHQNFRGTCFTACTKVPRAASRISLVATSEKVVIVILLARICATVRVAPISVTYVLVVQFVQHVHRNTNKSQEYAINME